MSVNKTEEFQATEVYIIEGMHGEMHDLTCPTNEGVIFAKRLENITTTQSDKT